MERTSIESVLAKCFRKLDSPRSMPEESDWKMLGTRFDINWSKEFVFFMELCCEYDVDWQFLSVIKQTDNSADTIEGVYDHEMKSGQWKGEYVPFHDVGNGDYYCLKANESNDSVYYFDHTVPEYRQSDNSVGEWILLLPEVFA